MSLINNIKAQNRFAKKMKEIRKQNQDFINDSSVSPKIGYIIDYKFLYFDKFQVVSTKIKHEAILSKLNCIVITNQRDYNRYINDLDVLISAEPGWAAPFLKLGKNIILSYMGKSDPHKTPHDYFDYFKKSKFDFLISPYFYPSLYYFKEISKNQIHHSPWALPLNFFDNVEIMNKNQKYLLNHGAYGHDLYKTRNYCNQFDFVTFKHFSGSENMVIKGKAYLDWLAGYDAAISATSIEKHWRYTVAKYMEIPASGALLFAQETDDLELLGFKDKKNCVIFNENNFEMKAHDYFKNQEEYLEIRKAGYKLIKEKHTIDKRVIDLQKHIMEHI